MVRSAEPTPTWSAVGSVALVLLSLPMCAGSACYSRSRPTNSGWWAHIDLPFAPLNGGSPQRPAHCSQPPLDTLGGLTTREREIAGLVAEVLNNREIGYRLGISARTVEGHVELIR